MSADDWGPGGMPLPEGIEWVSDVYGPGSGWGWKDGRLQKLWPSERERKAQERATPKLGPRKEDEP